MSSPPGDRIRSLLSLGFRLMKTGRARDAIHAFGRILLADPGHPAARRGLEGARRVAAEQSRELEAKIDEARSAVRLGERERARAILENVVRSGGDTDHAREMLDGLERRRGRVTVPIRPPDESSLGAFPGGSSSSREWPRRVFAASFALIFVLAAASLALGWEHLVESLVRVPAPTPITSPLPMPSDEAPRP